MDVLHCMDAVFNAMSWLLLFLSSVYQARFYSISSRVKLHNNWRGLWH